MGENPKNIDNSNDESGSSILNGDNVQAGSDIDSSDVEIDLGDEEDFFLTGSQASLPASASAQAVAANKAMVALDRAARSFTLYDPTNSAVISFLEAIEDGFRDYLAAFGALDLQVLPYELKVGKETVYEQPDREQSLAFKLFRDGVRRLVIEKSVVWDELLRLLEILSVRYSGVRVKEDDVVTLLWKAGFKGISVDAVEGFVADDEETFTSGEMSEEDLSEALEELVTADLDWQEGVVLSPDFEGADRELFAQHQADMDMPLPDLPPPVALEYQFVDDDDLEDLLLEDGSAGLPRDCLSLVSSLLDLELYGEGEINTEEFLPLILEVRDFCLTQGQLLNLMKLLEILTDYAFEMDEDHIIHTTLRNFANHFALGRLVRSLPSSAQHPPQPFYSLLNLLPGNHIEVLVSLLMEIRTSHARRILRQLIEHFGVGSEDVIVAAIREAAGPVAADLLRVLSVVDNDRAMIMLTDLATTEDNEVRLQCFHMMERNIQRPEVRPVVHQTLNSNDEIFRVRALELLTARGDLRDFPFILRHILGRALNLSDNEANASGIAMATVDPDSALSTFTEWIKPKGLFGKLKPVQPSQDLCAIAGLGIIEDEIADDLLSRLSKRSGERVHQLCMKARINRHRVIRENRQKHSGDQGPEGDDHE